MCNYYIIKIIFYDFHRQAGIIKRDFFYINGIKLHNKFLFIFLYIILCTNSNPNVGQILSPEIMIKQIFNNPTLGSFHLSFSLFSQIVIYRQIFFFKMFYKYSLTLFSRGRDILFQITFIPFT